jgi:hypothetical protein
MLYKDEKKALAKVSALFKEGKFADIKEGKEKRSIPQNDLYWMWVSIIADKTKNNKETVHNFLKSEFLTDREIFMYNDDSVVEFQSVKSTTILNTKQFADFLNEVEVFSITELNEPLPHPEDLGFAELFEKYGN